MDLFAYAQIGLLDEVVKAHGIEVPRLRGYRLMSSEQSVSWEQIKEICKDAAIDAAEHLCCTYPRIFDPSSHCTSYNSYTDYVRKYFLVFKDSGDAEHPRKEVVDIRWDRIHGWKRKALKFEIRKAKKRIRKQYEMWNQYCGRDDVLYIHARLGDFSWSNPEIKKGIRLQPWFIGCVDDWWDRTYCDIYAKIDPEIVKSIMGSKDKESESD